MKILELIISKKNKIRKAQLGNDFITKIPPRAQSGGRERKNKRGIKLYRWTPAKCVYSDIKTHLAKFVGS